MGIPDLAANLTADPAGIWVSRSADTRISYPGDGNRRCFGIEDGSFWFAHRNDCIVAAMKLHPPDGPLLDAGGGNGFVARRLLDEGFETALLEPGPTGAFNARTRRGIPDVICATLEDCGFRRGSISAVSLFDVLEHIEDDGAFLDEVRGCLRPGGYLYITVPAFSWLRSGSDAYAGHYRRYSPGGLVRLLDRGFEVVFISCIFRALTIPMLLLRALPWRLGLCRNRGALPEGKEHGIGGGFAVRAARRLLSHEPAGISSGRRYRSGTSCLCVARKIQPAPLP